MRKITIMQNAKSHFLFQIVFLIFIFGNSASAQNTDDDFLYSKKDAKMMFDMSKDAWKKNVIAGKKAGAMDYVLNKDYEYTMLIQSYMAILGVTPYYHHNKTDHPWKLSIITIYNQRPFASIMKSWTTFQIEDMFKKAMKELSPEYSVVGFMNKKEKSVEVHMSIFKKGSSPKIDAMNLRGEACLEKCLK